MKKAIAGTLLVSAILLPQVSVAGVYMCVDPVSGKKSFTDRACPTLKAGTKIRVEPTNFGGGIAKQKQHGTWSSEKDRTVAGRANLADDASRVAATRHRATLVDAGS